MHTDTIEDFVKSGKGQSQLVDAIKQQKDLSYFTQSKIQQDVTDEYWKNWAERKYATNDMFLNYVKHVFRPDNSMSFTKFMRYPLPSAELINNRIKEPLERVFHADDSYFKYNIRGEMFQDIPELNSEKFDMDMFNALLFGHNNILVTTVVDTNTPARQIINIENVIAIDSEKSVIDRIAYTAMFGSETGYMYMDSMQYAFLNNKFEIREGPIPHDLGETPADFITKNPLGADDAVRESIFSYVRGDLEEYVFLKTMLKMTEPNGVIPVVTQLDTKDVKEKKDTKGQKSGEPSTANSMGSQKAKIASGITPSTNELQTGTTIKIKQRLKEDGSIDSDIVENYFHFYHMPIEPLEYIKGRIKDLKTDITISLLGNFSEQNDSAKNEMQVEASFVNKEDKLRSLSIQLSRIKKLSDFKFLALQHGKDNVSTDGFFGSDFFLETKTQLFEMFEKAPNPIERKSILVKTTKNKYRFNEPEKNRTVLLYNLMPFCSDIDFDKAIERGVDPVTFSYQIQFNHWVSMFESQFGDIWLFFEALEGNNDRKILLINNLIINLIPKATIDGRKDPTGDTKSV